MRWRRPKVTQWRPWFAWYPVTVNDSTVWLEWVERRGILRQLTREDSGWYVYQLRLPGITSESPTNRK
jgi:hypothetical protein